jgi:hypothetical protein
MKKVTGRTTVRDSLPCAELAVVFNSAAAFMQDHNMSTGKLGRAKAPDEQKLVNDIRSFNSQGADFYKNNQAH